jgi:CubicO group peptidase (beta-lactamase class C family)
VIRSAVMPAATLNSTAHDLSVFYQMLINGGTYNGVRLLQPETIETAVQLGSDGYDHIVGDSMRWALGFHLGGRPGGESDESLSGMGKGSTVRTFGHFGMGTCMAWADPDEKLVVAFTCNRLLAGDKGNVRWIELSNAVWDCVRTVSVSRS